MYTVCDGLALIVQWRKKYIQRVKTTKGKVFPKMNSARPAITMAIPVDVSTPFHDFMLITLPP